MSESETLDAQLSSVRAAISALESGNFKSYRLGGISYEYHDLATLYDREERLLKRIANQTSMEERVCEF